RFEHCESVLRAARSIPSEETLGLRALPVGLRALPLGLRALPRCSRFDGHKAFRYPGLPSLMEPRAAFVIGTIILMMTALAANRIAVDLAMLTGLTILLVGDSLFGGILDLSSALHGFANPALVLIGTLFVVAAGLERTGAIEKVAKSVLGHPKSERAALARLTIPVALMSSMMNNTPIVAMYLPIVRDWSRRLQISSSKFLMPLSFAAILGGQLTLIGTASNVVVMGLYRDFLEGLSPDLRPAYQLSPLEEFWGVASLGGPAALAGLIFMIFGSRLIPA